ncbi:MAG: shikimate kinase AroL [Desulfovibrionales bacterium]|nr:shikimate kinase AroL [Desulfovibrionales bacterium]
MNAEEHIFLTGARGSGKTSVGKGLAARLGYGFVDTDALLCAMQQRTVEQIVAAEGWEAFRTYETTALDAAIKHGRSVIATGGGIITQERNCALMQRHGHVVFLDVSPKELARRLEADPEDAQRPSLTGAGLVEEIGQVLAERMAKYTACADNIVDGDQPVDKIIDNIMELLDNNRDS